MSRTCMIFMMSMYYFSCERVGDFGCLDVGRRAL